jgi:hypothetical protein
MIVPSTITIEELPLILLLSLPIILWGFRHGLDAILIAVIGSLAGMVVADTIAAAMVTFINTSWRLGKAVLAVGFEPIEKTAAQYREIEPLIQTPEQIKLLGTIVFAIIAFVAFRIAYKRAGGRKNILEGIFGAIGGLVMGYIVVTFILPRHFELPTSVQITATTQLPVFNVDANVAVLLALVVIVFGVQSARPKKK